MSVVVFICISPVPVKSCLKALFRQEVAYNLKVTGGRSEM